jgi:hypothetical protein
MLEYERTAAGMLIMPGGGNDTLDYDELQRRTGWAMSGGAVTQGRTLNYLGWER